MNAGLGPQGQPESSASSVLRTLVLCDLVDSTALVERLGDREAAELIRKHDRLARTLADRHGGREIDKTDGFLMMFERPVSAVAFALEYQRGLRQFNAAEKTSFSARVGIHVGEVVVWDNSVEDIAKGAKPVEVEGLVKPVTSRLMNLALPGQILLSNIAYDLAHRAQGELGGFLATTRWRTHGRYRFRGVPDPVAVFEVGEEGLAPLKAPPWSSKAHREVPFWRRPATMAIEALVIAAVIVVPLFMFLRPDPAIAFAKRDWVVVGSLHNLTGETVFDDALESALRIGLEQSRYVNVLPNLKVRDTITRMHRDPDNTAVDREVGSEIAVRDGARALILPTIAEIGGRVRITAEVIDPQTQTTVYSETADGIGKESILPSLDAINNRLRVKLGEALATVSDESMPLEKVTTGNLDALRAYSLALKVNDRGDQTQAETLFKHAIELDNDFARARIALGSLYLDMDRRADARVQLDLALSAIGRLDQKDKLLVEAWLTVFTSPRDALEKWSALASLEPDHFQAQGAYAYYLWIHSNDFRSAIEADKRNAIEQNPNNGTGHYLLGTLYLGMERYEDARREFEESARVGTLFQNDFYASSFAAQRLFPKVADLRNKGRVATTHGQRASSAIFGLTLDLDQGKWSEVAAGIKSAGNASRELEPPNAVVLGDAVIATRLLLADKSEQSRILEEIAGQGSTGKLTEVDPSLRDMSLLFRAWLATDAGNHELASRLVRAAGADSRSGDYPALSKMLDLVQSSISASQGQGDEMIRHLRSAFDGTELYASHVLLMKLLADRQDFEGARKEAVWLGAHRGRAYTEVVAGEMFAPFNVFHSTLAKIDEAEYSVQLRDLDAARDALTTVRTAWPDAEHMPKHIARLVKQVDDDIKAGSARN